MPGTHDRCPALGTYDSIRTEAALANLSGRDGAALALRPAKSALADSAVRSQAEERIASGEPILAGLVAAATIRDEPPQYRGDLLSDAATTVPIAVGEAVTQLEAIRLRRGIENAAFDNVWRG
jgi:hypothetical protein